MIPFIEENIKKRIVYLTILAWAEQLSVLVTTGEGGTKGDGRGERDGDGAGDGASRTADVSTVGGRPTSKEGNNRFLNI